MQTEQLTFHADGKLTAPRQADAGNGAQLVFAFGSQALFRRSRLLDELRGRYPDARIVTCTSGGEIRGTEVLDDSVVATAVRFGDASVKAADVELPSAAASEDAGRCLASKLPHEGLRHVLVFSDGLNVNGSALVSGLTSGLPDGVSATGGLAADGDRFEQTGVGLDAAPAAHRVVAVGLYGPGLRIGMGSLGGWDEFGPEYTVTRSEGNVLFELGGRPALDVYKEAMGPRSFALPASGLLYPLHLRTDEDDVGVVRTLLSIDPRAKSITFAGDIPVGRRARLMRANLDRVIDAAGTAANHSTAPLDGVSPSLVLLVSCIGRKLVLQRRVTEELESARRIFGAATFAGFYSYGEISPMTPDASCQLHNQTMTITAIGER